MSSVAVVERRNELRRIADYSAAAARGRGGAVCLLGAAGIGKTALLRAALSEAPGAGLTSATGTCWREGSGPFEPWLDILCQLGVTTATTWPYLPGLAGFVDVERALADASRRAPLMISLDDLHNGDEGTLLLTRYLAGRCDGSSLLLLAATREAGTAGLLAEALRLFDQISLSPLTGAAVRELCTHRGYRHLASESLDALTTATGGIPLQVIVALEAASMDAEHLDLTVDLPTMIIARMAELPAAQATIIAKAATVGQLTDRTLIAGVARVAEPDAVAAIRAAQTLGIAKSGPPTVLDLRHDLVRKAVQSWLTPAARAEAEGAAADWFTARSLSDPSQLTRAAHHAIAAAEVDPRYARQAIDLGRLAARSLAAQGAPEDGAQLLDRLIAINRHDPVVTPASLLVEHAQAVLLTGRLGAAMRHFDDALTTALAAEDLPTVAEAAAGLGALWVNSIRTPDTQSHVLATQRHVLQQLPPGFSSLHLRLHARIAAEAMFWEAAPPGPLLAVIDDALRLGDPATVLEVLSVAHNPLLGPQHTGLRLSLAAEMISRATDVGTGVLPLMASCWRTVDLFLAGDTQAPQALAQLRAAAEASQSLSVLYIVRAIEAMVLICRGQFASAESAAHQAYELGCTAEDPDALSYLTAHLVAIGWYRGRDAELLALMEHAAGNATIDLVDNSFDAAAAALAARAGQRDLSAHYLHKITKDGLGALPQFSTWLMTMALTIEAATRLGDLPTTAEAYAQLLPYADLPIMGSLAIVSLGSSHQWLGRAALALGRLDTAESHLRNATEADIHLGHLPAAAVSRALLADCLTRLPRQADRQQEITTLLARCRATATHLEMTEILRQTDEIAQRPTSNRITITRNGSEWVLHLGAETTQARDLVGIAILATLTASPDQFIAATQLAYGTSSPTAGSGSLMDQATQRAVNARMASLADAIAEAREDGDLAAQQTAENELDELADFLRESSGLGGRPRRFTDETERARTSVRKAIMRAIDDIQRSSPVIAAHLRSHVLTGTSCCYQLQAAPT